MLFLRRAHAVPIAFDLANAAFDAHLIGIDPDFRIHVSDRLLEIHDGRFLELGLKGDRRNVDRIAATERGSP
jgi:putative restriction endonuclease